MGEANGIDVEVSPGGLNIVHLNVASMLGAHKFEMLRKQIEGSSVDVFCASETWLTEGVPDGLVSIKGFRLTRFDRSWSDNINQSMPKKGGGLICYIREDLVFNEYRYAFLNQSTKNLEMQWVSLEINNMRRVIILNVYRPPQGDVKKACKTIHEALTAADLKDNADIFLLGDFNVDLINKTSTATKELLSTTALWGLKAQIKGVTRPNINVNRDTAGAIKGSCIDNVFTNSEHVANARTLNWNFSDHLAIYVKRKRASVKHKKVEFQGRSYKNYVKEDLQLELVQSDWDEYFVSDDVEWCWEYIDEKIIRYLDRVCPRKKFRVNEIRDPWVTDDILEQIKDKDSYVKIAKRSGGSEDWQRAKLERNRVGRLVELTKAEFLKDQQEQLADDPKNFWRVVKSIIPGKKSKTTKIVLANKETGKGKKPIDSEETANFINNFFSSIGPKLALNHNEPWVFLGDGHNNNCPNFATSFEQVRRLCKEINTAKSSGLPNCPSRVYKDAFQVIIPQLVFMFNLSFSKGAFPDEWKKATIIPLYKGGDKTDVSNYRPVSLLPLPGKIIEKIVHQ